MSPELPHFDEQLISGYIDGELTQQDQQRVRLHLESCAQCRQISRDLQNLTAAAMATTFPTPFDDQWDERPRTSLSRWLSYAGFGLLAIWTLSLVAFLVHQAVTDATSVRFEALLGLAPALAIVLIVASTAVDRLQTHQSDPYKKVQK